MSLVLCAVQSAELHPFLTIQREGQEKTWLTADRETAELSLVKFWGDPLGARARRLELFHERVRFSKLGRGLLVADRLAALPWRSWIPEASTTDAPGSGCPTIRVHAPDALPLFPWKYLGLFNYFLEETKAQFLYTTNVSAYVRIDRLEEVARVLPKRNLVAGSPVHQGPRTFISGANRWLSRDVVTWVVRNAYRWDRGRLEDVGLSSMLRSAGYSLTTLPTINIDNPGAIQELTADDLAANYHFRIKASQDRHIADVAMMHSLHGLFGPERGTT